MQNDLISRSALKKTFEAAGFGDHSLIESVLAAGVYAGIDDAPTIDAVPVVRCRECKHRGDETNCPMCEMVSTWNEDDGSDYYFADRTDDDGYCHKGAKMDGGAEK